MRKERFKVSLIPLPAENEGAIIIHPKFSSGTSAEIAGKLVSDNNGRTCRTIGKRILVYSSDYLKAVANLDPEKRTHHIEQIALGLRSANAVIFQRD